MDVIGLSDDEDASQPPRGESKRSTNSPSEPISQSDADRDALHILPLSIVPLETLALRRARMVKNGHLKSVIEFFSDEASGRGHMELGALSAEFGWPEDSPHPDLILLRKLALLPSYDVYSLRILLREQGIHVGDIDALKLSPHKVEQLTEYMTNFTHPLIVQIFGNDDLSIQSFEDIIALFRDPDIKKARQKLKIMADKLGIGVADVPRFLEDYGDVFLSLSYFRQCLDEITPIIDKFFDSLKELRSNYQLKNDHNLMNCCTHIETTLNERLAAITGRMENFDLSTKDIWNDISAERFRKVKAMITSYHTTIGGVLCALSVKMNAWNRLFPDSDVGGPIRRSEFIMSEMCQGIENIQKIEDDTPMLASLN